MIKDSALQFLASIYQSNLSHLCSTATLCSRKGTQLMPTLGPRCTQARGLCNNFHPFLMTKQPTQKKTLQDWRWALPTHGKSSKQGPAPWINEKVSVSITLWSTEQTLIIHTNHGDYHQYQKLPDTSICSTWKILCGQGDTHVKDVTSLPSISTPCSSARAADPAQRPNFPKARASWILHANPPCSTGAVKSGMLRTHGTDSLTASRCSATVDKQAGPRQSLRQNCCRHNPAWGQLSYCRAGPSGFPGTEHMRLLHCILHLWLGNVEPGSWGQTCYAQELSGWLGCEWGSCWRTSAAPRGSAPLPWASAEGGMVKPQVRQQVNQSKCNRHWWQRGTRTSHQKGQNVFANSFAPWDWDGQTGLVSFTAIFQATSLEKKMGKWDKIT